MRVALGLAALLSTVACGGEARKLGEVDVGGSSGGLDAASGGVPVASGGSGSTGEATGGTGGTPLVIGLGGSENPMTVGTGGGQTILTGGSIPLSVQEHTALTNRSCTSLRVESATLPVNLELVVDNSASMGEPVSGANGLSKWQVTRDALLEAVVGMTGAGLDASIQVGLLLYPLSDVRLDERTCTDASQWIPRAPLGVAGSPQRTLIGERLLRAVPTGITNTFDAYFTAFEYDFLARKPAGSRFIVLVTDGAPTALDCANPKLESAAEDPQPIIDSIASANRSSGVRTIVIGTPGSEANRRWLSEAAIQGGTAAAGCDVELGNCHVDLSVNPDLSATLNGGLKPTVGSITDCSYEPPPPPSGGLVDFDGISVVLTAGGQSTLLLRSTLSDCSTGWQLAYGKVQLCPESCAAARDALLEILLDCTPVTR